MGTARNPSLSCDPDLSATKDSPPMPRPPTREKQQPAPRLTLRDLQNKSNCSSPSSSAAGLLHTASPEPPGPPQQPTTTELSLATITVPLESIKPSEWAKGAGSYRLNWVSTPSSSTPSLPFWELWVRPLPFPGFHFFIHLRAKAECSIESKVP